MPYPYTPGPGDEATWPAYTGHPNDPRNDDLDDDTLDAESAQEMAAEQCASNPGMVSQWLADICDTDGAWQPVETMRVHEASLQDAPVHILFAVMMTGTDQQAGFARMFLRDRFEEQHRAEIDERADELLLAANGLPDDTPAGYHNDYDD